MRRKKIALSAAAAVMILVLTASLLIGSGLMVQASDQMMPGIETIIEENSQDKPLKLLEIVSDYKDAQLGYFVGGQEPYIRLYQKLTGQTGDGFADLEDGLSQIQSAQERREFAEGTKFPLLQSLKSAGGKDAPFSYAPYEEAYFLGGEEQKTGGWKRVEFVNPITVLLHGRYEPVANGAGDYTKSDTVYYPVGDAAEQAKAGYNENILGFTCETSGSRPYNLKFLPVMASDLMADLDSVYDRSGYNADDLSGNAYGYYENIYSYLPTDGYFGEKELGGDTPVYIFEGIDQISGLNQYVRSLEVRLADGSSKLLEQLTLGDVKRNLSPGNERGDCMITSDESGRYIYWTVLRDPDGSIVTDEFGNPVYEEHDLLFVEGRQMVAKENVNPDAYDGYYFRVKDIEFSCSKKDGEYSFDGEYAAIHPMDEEAYLPVGDPRNGHYWASEDEYSLTPGKGNYEFVADEDEKNEVQVIVRELYYRGGYTNQEWFKKYVMNLLPENEAFDDFCIQVDTMTSKELAEAAAASGVTEREFFSRYRLVCVNGAVSGTQAADLFYCTGKQQISLICDRGLDEESKENTYTALLYEWLGKENFSQVLISADVMGPDDITKALKDCASVCTGQLFLNENVFFFNGEEIAELSEDWEEKELPSVVNRIFPVVFPDSLNERSGMDAILKYIETENRLRQIENTGDATGEKHELLSGDITQARVWEYLLNYRYRRTLDTKGTIRVLDLEPSASKGMITEGEIRRWMGLDEKVSYEIVDFCCDCSEDNNSDRGNNIGCIADGSTSTFWHVSYDTRSKKYHLNKNLSTGAQHSFTIKVSDTSSGIRGFKWVPRQASDGPRVQKYRILGSNSENGNYKEIKTTTGNLANSSNAQDILFGGTQHYKYYRFDVMYCYKWSGKYNFAACAEFELLTEEKTKIEITTMTTNEFVGKIGDVNTDYDMIFVGSDTSDDFYFPNKRQMSGGQYLSGKRYPSYTESAMNGMVYVHVGDVLIYTDTSAKSTEPQLAGMLDSDYLPVVFRDGGKEKRYLLSPEYNALRSGLNSDGKYVMNWQYTPAFGWLKNRTDIIDRSDITSDYKYRIGNLGCFRLSGNDITSMTVQKLQNFARSGYPVITENDLYNGARSGNGVNESVVDNSSYVYEFLDSVKSYDNVRTRQEMDEEKNSLNFYINLPKPAITFLGEDGTPPVYSEKKKEYISADSGELSFHFQIKDEAAVSQESMTYNCRLFVDLNTDGNFAGGEQIPDISVLDADGNPVFAVDGVYQLKVNKEYYAKRSLPETYIEVINWKFEIENNQNPNIRTSETGLSKLEQKGEKAAVKVLQVMPDAANTWSGVTWNLSNDGSFKRLLNGVEEFSFDITSITASAFGKNPGQLDGKDMLILGFADLSSNISDDKGAVQKILQFIQDGKSVLFAHDNTSFINYSSTDTFLDRSANADANWSGYPTGYSPNEPGDNSSHRKPGGGHGNWNWVDWGYNMNSFVRTAVGMDRYGITSDVSDILKRGEILSAGTEEWDLVSANTDDMPYVAGSNRTQTYPELHGYATLEVMNPGTALTTSSVRQVNKGVITEYPYKIDETFQIATTHGQYYQLGLEADDNKDGESDVVVWYCLAGGDYEKSPNDMRSNYYIYSKGNVMYTGVGHSPVTLEMEKKLFVNTIVAAYHSSVRQPAVDFVESNNFYAQKQNFAYFASDYGGAEEKVLKEEQTLYFRVSDRNLINSDMAGEEGRRLNLHFYQKVNPGEAEVELYSWNEISGGASGSQEDNKKQYRRLDDQIGVVDESGQEVEGMVESGHVYTARIRDLNQILAANGGIRDNCEIYVTVNGKINSYGKEVALFSSDTISLRKQQLFNLD